MNPGILHLLRDIGLLAVGALLGFLGSFAMWKWQLGEQRREKRGEHILRATHLAASSLTYARSLLYSKPQGTKGILDLPENPVDELMALACLNLREIIPLVRELHNKQQELFAFNIQEPHAADKMLQLTEGFAPVANQIREKLEELAELNGKQASKP